ncbi:hypothetical protein A2U01_0015374, partial [Trifolium medium]|nr:hypothetical protein [Trifolium medium]
MLGRARISTSTLNKLILHK